MITSGPAMMPATQAPRPRVRKISWALFIAACVAVILAHVGLGFFSFPQLDDYDQARDSRAWGYLKFMLGFYRGYSGRFSWILTSSAINRSSLFPYHTNLYDVSSLVFFTLSLGFCIARTVGARHTPVILADIAFLFLAMPHYVKREAFYMETHNIVYMLSLSWGLLAIGMVTLPTGPAGRWIPIVLGVIGFYIGGFTEPLPLVLIAGTGAYLFFHARRGVELHFRRVIALGGGVAVGFCINALAPGNYNRLGKITPIMHSVFATGHFIEARLLTFLIATTAYAVLRSWFAGTARPSQGNARLAMMLIAGVMGSCFFLSILFVAWGLHRDFPPPRTLLLPCVFAFVSLLYLSDRMGREYPSHLPKAFMALLAIVAAAGLRGGIGDLVNTIEQASVQRRMALQQIDWAIAAKDAGLTSLIVPRIPNRHSMLLNDQLGPRPHGWNKPQERYFGLRELSAE